MASWLVICHPAATPGTTNLGLKTPNAAATTSPGTWPMQAPRLVKYDFSSGRATPSWPTGLPSNPRAAYAACASGAKYTPAATGSTALRSRRAFSLKSFVIR